MGAANDGEEEARVDRDRAEDYDAADVIGPDNAVAWVLAAHCEYLGSEDGLRGSTPPHLGICA